MNLAELRQQLESQVRDGQLPEALKALLTELPENSETYRIVSALIARLNSANKERFRNTISLEEYQRRVDQVAADFFDLLGGLQTTDFEVQANASKPAAGKRGSVLYRVPDIMKIQKPVRCTIRVALDEDVILEDIVLDEHVTIRSRVEVSDVMSAELFDPEGGTFQINALNARTQLVKDSGYTEWNFNVTPLKEGVHQLLVKVSIMEMVPGFSEPIPHEVSLMETITIVTESAAPGDPPTETFKESGQTFAFRPAAALNDPATNQGAAQEKDAGPPPAPPSVQPSVEPAYPEMEVPVPSIPQRVPNRSLRALALFLAFVVIVPAATWAIAPDLPAWINVHYIQGTPEAYAGFIAEHPKSPRIETAYFYLAEKSGRLADLRTYEQRFGNSGKFHGKVAGKIAALETRSIENIRLQPDSLNIRNFVRNFPESERLPEVKQAVENRPEKRQKLIAEVENAYLTSMQMNPTETKVIAYLRDFPKQEHLNEVVAAVNDKPEVFSKVQPILEDAYLKKMEQNPTKIQSEQFLEKFPEPVRKDKFEKILDKKPELKKEAQSKMRKIESARQLRERRQ